MNLDGTAPYSAKASNGARNIYVAASPTPSPSTSPSIKTAAGDAPLVDPFSIKEKPLAPGLAPFNKVRVLDSPIPAPTTPTGGQSSRYAGSLGLSQSLSDWNYYYKAGTAGQAALVNVINSTAPNRLANALATAPTNTPEDLTSYMWNLPPHLWSLPVTPYTVHDSAFLLQESKNKDRSNKRRVSVDRYRRGRIWYKQSDSNLTTQVGTDTRQYSFTGSLGNNSNYNIMAGSGDWQKYGFQFLWNPDSLQTSIGVNMDATPSVNDRFLAGAGFFPGTETFSLNLRIDRTNDFACAAGALTNRPSAVTVADGLPETFVTEGQVKPFAKFYQGLNSNFISKNRYTDTIEAKLVDLFQRGTLADIEYLYRCANGKGPADGKDWVNGRGMNTADIGFLTPTLLNIDVGPLSYAGYITNMTVSHIAFTPDMIPIRSDVQLAFNVLATAGLNNKTKPNTN